MDNEFYTLLTNKGMAKIAAALAEKKQLHLQKMAVGDGGGQYYEPAVNQTKLRREVWRGEMNTLTVAPNNPNWLIAEVVLPENIGGWYVREVGVFDTDGDLIAIGKFPESYKPLLPGGSGKQVCIRLIMEVSNTTAVTLTVDPSVVLATRDYVDSLLDEHEHSTRHPDATLTQKGFTQLSNATNSDDETKAATPKAVKAALAEARNHTHTWSQISGVPDGTLTQKGIVKLNNATNSTSTTEAATPSAVKAAMDKANAAAPASHTHPWNQVTGVPDGTLTQKGVVKLNNATNSTSTTEAATPSAVKAIADMAKAAGENANSALSKAQSASGSFAIFKENGQFTIPNGATKLFVEVLGGGGGGGGGDLSLVIGSSVTKAQGGEASQLAQALIEPVSPGATISVTVGAGGGGGLGKGHMYGGPAGSAPSHNSDSTPGTAGGSSSFMGVISHGGKGGSNASSLPGTGNSNVNGSNGESSIWGSGGRGSSNHATGYGAGGAGGSTASSSGTNGGNGSSGFVRIWW